MLSYDVFLHAMRHLCRVLIAGLLALLAAGWPSSAPAQASARFLPGFPLLRQQHSLTCESSAASMATRGRLSETQIMAIMPRNPNPNLGFRGNPDGIEGTSLIDYGVYAAPVQRALSVLGYHSETVSYGYDSTLRGYIDRGWPVVAWITYNLKPSKPRLSWANGSQFFLVPWEHAILVVGYDANSIIANDPWLGTRVRYSWRKFNTSWGNFGEMALGVQPCPVPQPVMNLRLSVTTNPGLTWTWSPSVRAASYGVRVVRHLKHDKVMFSGTTTDPAWTLTRVKSGAYYEIAVWAIAQCGAISYERRLWVQAPIVVPTATPPPETVVPIATSTPVPSPSTPIIVTTPTATSAPVSPTPAKP